MNRIITLVYKNYDNIRQSKFKEKNDGYKQYQQQI